MLTRDWYLLLKKRLISDRVHETDFIRNVKTHFSNAYDSQEINLGLSSDILNWYKQKRTPFNTNLLTQHLN